MSAETSMATSDGGATTGERSATTAVQLKVLLFSSPERQARIYFDALGSRYDCVTVGFEEPGAFVFEQSDGSATSRRRIRLPVSPRYFTIACQWMRVFLHVLRRSRGRRFDIIVSAGIQAALLFPLFRVCRCANALVYWAGDWFPDDRRWARLDRLASRLADETWNITDAVRRARGSAHGLPAGSEGPVVTSLLCAPEPPAPGTAARRPYFCYLGRAWAGRGIDIAVAAMAILREKGIVLDLVVTGRQQKEDEEYVRNVAAEAGVAEQVRWTGHIPLTDLNALLRGSLFGLAVFPGGAANYSNFTEPGKVTHCLQLGVPVVISMANAMAAEVLESGAGILVDDSPEDLARAAERFHADPAFASLAGRQARAMAERRASPEALFRHLDRVAARAGR